MSTPWTKELADKLDAAYAAVLAARNIKPTGIICDGCDDEKCPDCGPNITLEKYQSMREEAYKK